jgi:hypothetical protein
MQSTLKKLIEGQRLTEPSLNGAFDIVIVGIFM